MHARANLLLQRGATSEALHSLRAAVAANPGDPAPLLRLGQALYDGQRFSEAEDAYRRALVAAQARHADPGPAQRALAQIMVRTGQIAAAEAALDDHLAAWPGDADAWMALGLLRLHSGDPETARQAFDRILRDRPRSPAALYNRGRVALHEGDLDAAVTFFERLRQTSPRHPYGDYGLAIVAARRRQTDKACAGLKAAHDRGLFDGRAVLRDRALRAAGPLPCVDRIWNTT